MSENYYFFLREFYFNVECIGQSGGPREEARAIELWPELDGAESTMRERDIEDVRLEKTMRR